MCVFCCKCVWQWSQIILKHRQVFLIFIYEMLHTLYNYIMYFDEICCLLNIWINCCLVDVYKSTCISLYIVIVDVYIPNLEHGRSVQVPLWHEQQSTKLKSLGTASQRWDQEIGSNIHFLFKQPPGMPRAKHAYIHLLKLGNNSGIEEH